MEDIKERTTKKIYFVFGAESKNILKSLKNETGVKIVQKSLITGGAENFPLQ